MLSSKFKNVRSRYKNACYRHEKASLPLPPLPDGAYTEAQIKSLLQAKHDAVAQVIHEREIELNTRCFTGDKK